MDQRSSEVEHHTPDFPGPEQCPLISAQSAWTPTSAGLVRRKRWSGEMAVRRNGGPYLGKSHRLHGSQPLHRVVRVSKVKSRALEAIQTKLPHLSTVAGIFNALRASLYRIKSFWISKTVKTKPVSMESALVTPMRERPIYWRVKLLLN